MKKDIQVSVIIPTYYDWQRLHLCLKALDEQTYPKEKIEIIVVNNDPSDHIPKNYSLPINCRVVEELQPGSYAARNTGIKNAIGEIIAFTDSDCIPSKDWLKEGIDCLIKDSSIGVVAGEIKLFFKGIELNPVEVFEKYTAFNQQKSAVHGFCTTANWISFKKVIIAHGNFDENLKSNGDSLLSSKIYHNGYKIIYCDKALIYHPSRSKLSHLMTKRRRIIGGRFDRLNNGRSNRLSIYISLIKASFSFYRSCLKKSKLLLKKSQKEWIYFNLVSLILFVSLLFESFLLTIGKSTKR